MLNRRNLLVCILYLVANNYRMNTNNNTYFLQNYTYLLFYAINGCQYCALGIKKKRDSFGNETLTLDYSSLDFKFRVEFVVVLTSYAPAAVLSSAIVMDFGRTIGEPNMRWKRICEQIPIARETPNITV